ncbi:LPXTG cell wall anchor domain-containing protein [Actinokineospora pegani]|uniref:LPXTG cell wall anchor domain-containing protein n=1 Tax=Actinokineospora pegani TaxID=2654637 RepID=UPI0012EA5D53|nr:LPXTG cell wall anchor domain-containing protein [Actinokineospora pegani]
MSTSRSRVLARAAVVGVLASAASIGLVGTASAHTPRFDAKCYAAEERSEVKLNLTAYAGGDKNTVLVTDNGEELVNTTFGKSFSQVWPDLDPTIEHEIVVKVVASDNAKYNFDATETIDACVEPVKETTPPEEPTTTPEEPTTAPPTSETTPPVETTAPAPSTTPAAVPVGEDDLADTGASIALPLAIGGVLVLGGAGALVAVRRKTAKG